MALMTSLRTRMHFVLWALLALFLLSMTVGGLVGGANIIDQIFGRVNPSTAIGIVNGEKIDPVYFSRNVGSRIDQIRSSGQSITDQQLSQARSQVWNDLVREIIVSQTIEEMGITASDEEVLYHLKNNPPSFLRSNPNFQTNGQFDPVKYEEAINNPEGDEWFTIEQWMKNTYIPSYKLQQLIFSSATVTEDEINREFINRNINYTIDLIHVTDRIIDKTLLEPAEEEILAYYNENIDDYQRTENRNIRLVSWKKDPSLADTTEVFELASELKERIQNGEDFAALANEYTEDPSNTVTQDSSKGGSLGWFGKGQMVPAFEEAAFSAKKGELVGPVLSSFGYHVINVIDKKTEKDKEQVLASHILLKIDITPRTLDLYRGESRLFSYDGKDFGFNTALDSHQVKLTEMENVSEKSIFILRVGMMPSALQFIFNATIGEVSDPIENDNFFAVFTVDSVLAPGSKSFEKVKDAIKSQMTRERTTNETEILAGEFRKQVDDGAPFDSLIAWNENLEHAEKDKKTLSRGFTSIGRGNFINGALLNAQAGELLGPIKTTRGYTLMKVLEVQVFDSTTYAVQKDGLRTTLQSQKRNAAYGDWLNAKTEEAEIVDNRKFHGYN